MRADERQAAAAYAYAWWMTGDEDAASTTLNAALATPDPDESDDSARLAVLMTGVREALGDVRTMPLSSELALLHDGFGVPLEAAARLAGVPADGAGLALAHGRLEALLETVRDDFRHTEHLGGLAVGDPAAVAHAADCHSCGKALTLIERGRVELRAVAPVSAPPGMLARMVGDAAPAAATPAPEQDVDAPSVEELEAMLRVQAPDDVDVAAPPAEARAAAPPVDTPAPATDAPDVLLVPDAPDEAPVPDQTPPPEQAPLTSGRKRVLAVLAGGGILTFAALVGVMLNMDNDGDVALNNEASEDPAVTRTEPTDPPEPTTRPEPEPTTDPFGPPTKNRKGFAVVAAGLLLSGEEELAPSGTTIGPQDPLRVAVDYANGAKGAELNAVWRAGGRVIERLHTMGASRASRHVWGLPVPPEGWPLGRHRIVVTTEEGLAGAIDFTVRESD